MNTVRKARAVEEKEFTSHDGAKLFYRHWPAVAQSAKEMPVGAVARKLVAVGSPVNASHDGAGVVIVCSAIVLAVAGSTRRAVLRWPTRGNVGPFVRLVSTTWTPATPIPVDSSNAHSPCGTSSGALMQKTVLTSASVLG